jgi:hypothetical protein
MRSLSSGAHSRDPVASPRNDGHFRLSEIDLAKFLIFGNNGTSLKTDSIRGALTRMQYFVVMIDYGRRGREAIVDPEITRREVISRLASGEYRNISFIHEVDDRSVEDITEDILAEAAIPEIAAPDAADLQAAAFDHARDLRKHEPV